MLRIISLGAGVQSTTMALMAAHGDIEPAPDYAIFADTGWEPQGVYDHLAWLEQQLPFTVRHVTAGNIRDDLLATANGTRSSGTPATPPLFVKTGNAGGGFVSRQCTEHYKLSPIQREMRKQLGFEKGQRIPNNSVEVWLGISTDEAARMKPARVGWIINRFPLIEKRMSRGDCLEWMKRHDFPAPPKSACIGCPFHSDAEWRKVKERPDEWREAVMVDAAIRKWPSLTGEAYLHRSLKPLDQVDLASAEDRGQLNLFVNECEGMCGV